MYSENLTDLTDLEKTNIIVQMVYQGYVFKLPIFMCNQRDNTYGMGLNLGCVALANYSAYRAMKYYKSKRPAHLKNEYKIAFGYYQDNYEKLTKWVQSMSQIIESSAAVERRNHGLEILEAYYGLDEHIY